MVVTIMSVLNTIMSITILAKISDIFVFFTLISGLINILSNHFTIPPPPPPPPPISHQHTCVHTHTHTHYWYWHGLAFASAALRSDRLLGFFQLWSCSHYVGKRFSQSWNNSVLSANIACCPVFSLNTWCICIKTVCRKVDIYIYVFL